MHNRIHDTYMTHTNAKHNIKHKLILIFEIGVISPTKCRPSKNLPTLDHATHHAQQWVTPEMGLSSTQGKES
jgi:hypothetical protein